MSGSFSMDITKFVEKCEAGMPVVVRKIAFEAFKRIILRTPVDTGRARANWSVAIAKPQTQYLIEGADKSGSKTLMTVAGTIEEFSGQGSIFLTNNLPYVTTLEYGGYPSPPKSEGGKTVNGFSRQAPQGMVRLTCQEMIGYMKKATMTDIRNQTK